MVIDLILRRLLLREAERLAKERGVAEAQPVPGSAVGAAELVKLARRAEEVLSTVEVPGFDVDLVTSGAVKRIRVSRDGGAVAVFIDFTGSDPSCYFCKFINWTLWKRILRDAEARLKESGFRDVEFYDYATMAKIEYRAGDEG